MSSANFGRIGHPGGAVEFAASVPEGEIIASQAGSGAPVLILHGGPGLSDYTAPLAAELHDAFRVIRYQQRGVAPSTAAGPFGIDRHVADAIAVLDAAGAGRAYVIGHSWGGHLAMHLRLTTRTGCWAWFWSTRSEQSPTAARAIWKES
jgi:pimeloyl-ACP methyl ester carboxylesterase